MTPAQIAESVTGSSDRTPAYKAAYQAAAMAQTAEIYIVQDDGGTVVDIFWNHEQAVEFVRETEDDKEGGPASHSIIEETIS